MGKLKLLTQVSVLKFLYLNFLCKKVIRDKGKYIVPFRGAKIELHKGSQIKLHGKLLVCSNKVKGSREEGYLVLYENAKLIINGSVTLAYGSMVQGHRNSLISIGNCNINTRATIIADKEISIGDGVLISRDVSIFDSDFHPVLNDEGRRINWPTKVEIADHVWICLKATILRGVSIGKGAVIGANALVTTNVPEETLVSAIPGRAFGKIKWER